MFTAGIVVATALVATSVSAYGPSGIVPVYVDRYADSSCTGLPDKIDMSWGATNNLDLEDVNLEWFYDRATADCVVFAKQEHAAHAATNTTADRCPVFFSQNPSSPMYRPSDPLCKKCNHYYRPIGECVSNSLDSGSILRWNYPTEPHLNSFPISVLTSPTVLREQYLVYSRFNESTCTTGWATGWGKPAFYSHPPVLVRSLGGQCQPFAYNGTTLYRAATCAADGTARLKDYCIDKACKECEIDAAVTPTCQNMGNAGMFDHSDEWVQGFCMTPVAGQWDSNMVALARGAEPPSSSPSPGNAATAATGATTKNDGNVERVGSMALVASSVVLLIMTLN
ncbi:hypothetical protein HDU89_001555 [Geranomyces variabilis]|nr:hypothetical protein HDU89_001555 [Geranomyces variabilis]